MQPDLTPAQRGTASEVAGDSAAEIVPARRVLVDSPSWSGWVLLALALTFLIGAIVLTASGPIEWAVVAAIVCVATAVLGVRRLSKRA